MPATWVPWPRISSGSSSGSFSPESGQSGNHQHQNQRLSNESPTPITNKVITSSNLESRAESAAELHMSEPRHPRGRSRTHCRVRVLYPAINNANFRALPKDSILMQPVNASRVVRGVVRRSRVVAKEPRDFDGVKLDDVVMPSLDDVGKRLEAGCVARFGLDVCAGEDVVLECLDDFDVR